MTSNIVYPHLPENIAKEFSADNDGKCFVSRRGIARLCGVDEKSIRALLKKLETGAEQSLSRTLKPFAGIAFKGAERISDILTSAIIKHYSRLGFEVAEQTDDALGAIGLRAFIQQIVNYKPIQKRSLSREEIIELCVLPVPSDWQRRFPEEFYDNLSRLTGLTQTGTARPAIWAKHTKELVYDWLPSGIYDEVRRCKSETDSYEKLHQFLSDDGLKILELHQRQLLTLMTASSSIDQLKVLLNQSCTGNYQLILLGR